MTWRGRNRIQGPGRGARDERRGGLDHLPRQGPNASLPVPGSDGAELPVLAPRVR